MNWRETRVGEVILGNRMDSARENHVRSGVRVIAVEDNGLRVRRIHAVYLREEPEIAEEWTLRWDQLENYSMQLLPTNAQLPLL